MIKWKNRHHGKCCCSVTSLYPSLCNPVDCSILCFPVLHYLLEFSHTHIHWLGDVIQPSHPLSPPSPPVLNHSQHKVFSNELTLQFRCPKYWSLSFIISSSNEYSELISFRIDWLDLVLQGTIKGLLQHYSSKALILWFSAFFMVQLSHTYMATGNTKGLTIWTFVSEVITFSYAV